MRVITGTARGRKLVTVEGTEVVRPTTDGVKEAIFSAIQFEIEGRTVLDLFAGSGQLGIEALSLKSTRAVFDIAILDPPYNYKIIQKALPHLVEKMSENGVIICEHEKECVLPHDIGRYEIVKVLRHSRTSVTIYRPKQTDDEDSGKEPEA